MTQPPFADILPWLKVRPAEVEAILRAERYSLAKLGQTRTALMQLPDATHSAMASFALGSLGRLEASELSDLDYAFFYDSRNILAEQAERLRQRAIVKLREILDVPEKTFKAAIDVRSLLRNVGGGRDSNENLTYRALLLTEGAWLHNSAAARTIKAKVFAVYARGIVSRGRFLNSLGNDLHRYYRTLCVDYRFKVEEEEKAWALRIIKLRHARKVWHLANLALQCWFVDRWQEQGRDIYAAEVSSNDAQDEALASWLSYSPLARVAMAMRHFGAAELCRPLFLAYDRYLAALSSEMVREELLGLPHESRYNSPIYVALRENAEELDAAGSAIVEKLWERCRDYLVRFCIL